MAYPFAQPVDVAAIWRPLTDAETLVADARIAAASRLIRSRIPTIQERIDSGLVSVDDVRDVVVDMVYRVMTLPSYAVQQSITVDDATKATTFDRTATSAGLYLSDAEFARLSGTSASASYEIAPSY